MGARVYLPTIGRFTSVDPVEGGTANNYVYVLDPINSNDYSGKFSCMLQCTVGAIVLQSASSTTSVQRTMTVSSVQKVYAATMRIAVAQAVVVAAKAAATVAPQIAKVDAAYFANLTQDYDKAHPYTPEPAGRFDFVGAWGSADDWRKAGEYSGLTVGCSFGAAVTLGDPIGCGVAAVSLTLVTMPTFAVIGFVLGGLRAPGADVYEGIPDEITVFDGLIE